MDFSRLDNPFYINPTSGTTGTKKAAIASEENLYWNTWSVIKHLDLSPEDIHLCTFPSHVHPHETISRIMFLGGTGVLCETSPDALLEASQDLPLSCLMGNPHVVDLLYRYSETRPAGFPRLRLIELGGSPTPEPLFRTLSGLCENVVPVWGSAETSGVAFAETSGAMDFPGLIGVAGPGYEGRIDSMAPGEGAQPAEGELLVRGRGVVSGYCLAPVDDKSRFRDGWFHTGDRAVEENGVFRVLGRMDNMINVSGQKVQAELIESVLIQHPSVNDAAVLAVPAPTGDQRICALIVQAPPGSLVERDLISHCVNRLPRFAIPKEVVFLASLPRTSGGKLERWRLSQYCTRIPQ